MFLKIKPRQKNNYGDVPGPTKAHWTGLMNNELATIPAGAGVSNTDMNH
jgi:hypothetical protein